MKKIALCLSLLCASCISSAPIVSVTPANSAQIAVCQTDAKWHNAVVVGDFVIGGATSSLTAVAAGLATDHPDASKDIAIAAAAAGGLTLAGAAIAGLTASNFANSTCSAVVGALPAN